MGRARRLLLASAVLLAGFTISGPALAGGMASSPATDGAGLIRGGAPLPEFHFHFPDSTGTGLGGDSNLEISMSSPGQGMLRFLFSPRPLYGVGTDPATGTSRTYAGLNWNLFDSGSVFGNFGVGGTVLRGNSDDWGRRFGSSPFALHGTFELGYHVGDQHSLSLSLDHTRWPVLPNDRSEPVDDLLLRYGYRF